MYFPNSLLWLLIFVFSVFAQHNDAIAEQSPEDQIEVIKERNRLKSKIGIKSSTLTTPSKLVSPLSGLMILVVQEFKRVWLVLEDMLIYFLKTH